MTLSSKVGQLIDNLNFTVVDNLGIIRVKIGDSYGHTRKANGERNVPLLWQIGEQFVHLGEDSSELCQFLLCEQKFLNFRFCNVVVLEVVVPGGDCNHATVTPTGIDYWEGIGTDIIDVPTVEFAGDISRIIRGVDIVIHDSDVDGGGSVGGCQTTHDKLNEPQSKAGNEVLDFGQPEDDLFQAVHFNLLRHINEVEGLFDGCVELLKTETRNFVLNTWDPNKYGLECPSN
nr:hypothetical transcript [Hymenolepis microstoma]